MRFINLIIFYILSNCIPSYGVENEPPPGFVRYVVTYEQLINLQKKFIVNFYLKKKYIECYMLPAMRSLPGNADYPGFKNNRSLLDDPNTPFDHLTDPDEFYETQLKAAFEKEGFFLQNYADYCVFEDLSKYLYMEKYILPIMRSIPGNENYPGYEDFESLVKDFRVPFFYSTDPDEFWNTQLKETTKKAGLSPPLMTYAEYLKSLKK